MLVRHLHDCVHVAGYTGIMDRHNDSRSGRDKRFQCLRIDVRIARHRVREHHFRSFAQKRQGCTDERITGNDHLVSGVQVTQHRTHLQGIGAGGRQQSLAKTVPLFEPSLTTLGERTVTR